MADEDKNFSGSLDLTMSRAHTIPHASNIAEMLTIDRQMAELCD